MHSAPRFYLATAIAVRLDSHNVQCVTFTSLSYPILSARETALLTHGRELA